MVHGLGTRAALLVYPQIPDSEVGYLYHSEKFHYGTVARGKEGNLPLEEFKVGGPQKERQTADCVCRVPCRPAFALQPWCTQYTHPSLTHGFFPASLRHPHPHICCFFPIMLKPRMLLAGPPSPNLINAACFPWLSSGEKTGFMLEIIQSCKHAQ